MAFLTALRSGMSANARAWAEASRREQTVEVFLELYGLALCDPEAFPHGIATLYHAVEDVDFGLIAGYEPIDPALCAGIAGVGLVEFGH